MEVIGVLDLLGGRAVHAKGGTRSRYAPVPTAGGQTIDGDAVALASLYRSRWGLARLYAADLDAIAGSGMQDGLIRSLAAMGPLWLDPGVTSVADGSGALALGVDQIVVGLETLPSWEVLGKICEALGSDRVTFSLDLRQGVPIRHRSSPEELAVRAVEAGAGGLILLDLTRVGMSLGPDVDLVARVRLRVPDGYLVVGGGVRDPADLIRLENAGCDAVLVATALQAGHLDGYLGLPGPQAGS